MSDLEDFLKRLGRDRLAFAHMMNKARGASEPTPEFLQMMADNPDYVADHERSSYVVVPKNLRFTLHQGATVVKTALLRADIPVYEGGRQDKAYISINYSALAKFFPDMAEKNFRKKRINVEYEQRRCPATLSDFKGDMDGLIERMEKVENVLVYFLARFGTQHRRLYRTPDGQLVMPAGDGAGGKENDLSEIYHRALTYESFAAHAGTDQISFGIVTRKMLPHFCRLIELHYFHDEATRRLTTFAFPMLDIGKMRFVNNGPDEGAGYQRVVTQGSREIIKHDGSTTAEWLRHELCEMLAGPMREMEIIPQTFLNDFFGMVDDIRTLIVEGGPFNPQRLSPAHEALIPVHH